MNLVLIGPRGSGKSTIARRVAARLGWRVVSTDAECERRIGGTIASFVAEKGWDGFRALEREVVASLAGADETVVDTGGGAILAEANQAALKALGPVVYLIAPVETLAARISGDPNRPSLTGKTPTEEMADVLKVRDPIYRALATRIVDTSKGTPQEAADVVAALAEES